jgi:dihydrofolate reductase
MGRIDAMVIGRGTFETVLAFPAWPYTKPVFVLSNSIKEVPGKLKKKATILAMKPGEVLAHLSSKGFSNLYIDGGNVIQSFLKEDLIDELIISRVPVLIGSGIPLFGFLEKDLVFSHLQTKLRSNGLVSSYYERKRG